MPFLALLVSSSHSRHLQRIEKLEAEAGEREKTMREMERQLNALKVWLWVGDSTANLMPIPALNHPNPPKEQAQFSPKTTWSHQVWEP